MRRHLRGYMDYMAQGVRAAAAVLCAMLPRRYWPALDEFLPVSGAAGAAGILTVLIAGSIGIPGFLRHAQNQSDAHAAAVSAVIGMAETVSNRRFLSGVNGLSLFTFLLLTPPGWATMYLGLSGVVRAAGAWLDDPHGDFLLTAADAALTRTSRHRQARKAREAREALEGPEVPDRLVSGTQLGMPEAQLVVVASRRKPGWDAGTVILTQGPSYRIGRIVERTIHGRLRTLYPLNEHKDSEVFRRTVRYDLPAFTEAPAGPP